MARRYSIKSKPKSWVVRSRSGKFQDWHKKRRSIPIDRKFKGKIVSVGYGHTGDLKINPSGKGWHGDDIRHSNARKYGNAGPIYKTNQASMGAGIGVSRTLENPDLPRVTLVNNPKKKKLDTQALFNLPWEKFTKRIDKMDKEQLEYVAAYAYGTMETIEKIKRRKNPTTFGRGKIARAKRDVLARKLEKVKKIKEPYALATHMVKKGVKVKDHRIKREFAEQKRMKKNPKGGELSKRERDWLKILDFHFWDESTVELAKQQIGKKSVKKLAKISPEAPKKLKSNPSKKKL